MKKTQNLISSSSMLWLKKCFLMRKSLPLLISKISLLEYCMSRWKPTNHFRIWLVIHCSKRWVRPCKQSARHSKASRTPKIWGNLKNLIKVISRWKLLESSLKCQGCSLTDLSLSLKIWKIGMLYRMANSVLLPQSSEFLKQFNKLQI